MTKIIDKIVLSIPMLFLQVFCGMGAIFGFAFGDWMFLPCLIIFVSFILYTRKRLNDE